MLGTHPHWGPLRPRKPFGVILRSVGGYFDPSSTASLPLPYALSQAPDPLPYRGLNRVAAVEEARDRPGQDQPY